MSDHLVQQGKPVSATAVGTGGRGQYGRGVHGARPRSGARPRQDGEDERGRRRIGGPEPEGLRFFGTTWVGHDRGYAVRRAGVSAGALAATVAACLLLRFAYEGLRSAAVGFFVHALVVVVFAVCGAIAFQSTWDGFRRRPADPVREEALRGVRTVGFIGSLLAYFLRSLTEAPGEGLRRREYATALTRHERRRGHRVAATGRPDAERHGRV